MAVSRPSLLAALITLVWIVSGYGAVPAVGTARPERVAVVPTTVAPAYVQPIFNTPTFPDAIRDRELNLISQFQEPFNLPGEIQVSAFQFTDQKLATALVAAAEDGANVQVLLDGNTGMSRCTVSLMSGGCSTQAYAELAKLNTIHWTNPATWRARAMASVPGRPPPLQVPVPDVSAN